jgi:hypothetical protein
MNGTAKVQRSAIINDMRIGKRDTSRRLTGLILPSFLGIGGGGITWANDEGEKSKARSALLYLEDRRVLFDPFEVEIPDRCISSVNDIRGYLRAHIEQCNSPELRNPLRAIQAACRQFLTDTQAIDGRHGRFIDIQRGGTPSWLFNQALGSFRARVGISIAVMIETFDIDVDEHLAKILPPPLDSDTYDNAKHDSNEPSES